MPLPAIPKETQRAVETLFVTPPLYVRLRTPLETLSADPDLSRCFTSAPLAPWRLALISLMQYREALLDVDALAAVREQIDWCYALALPLDTPPLPPSALCVFRADLRTKPMERELLRRMAKQLAGFQFFAREQQPNGKRRPSARRLSFPDGVLEALRALNGDIH